MMTFFYNIGLWCYAFAIRLVAPFNEKARQWLQGRKNIFERLNADFEGNKSKIIWVHVSSLGEFEQGRPLIEKIKASHPKTKILLTFFSPSGYEIRKDYENADFIYYLPIDNRRNAQKFFDITKPSMVFFVKYDFWYHYLDESYKRKIPTFLISGLFRENQPFFKKHGQFYRQILHFFTKIYVQNEASKQLLASIGYRNVLVTGDTRIDRVITLAENVKPIPHILDFKQGKKIIVAGSTWEEDEKLWITYLKKYPAEDYKVIFAPHLVGEGHITQLENKLNETNVSTIRYSQIDETKDVGKYTVLIIDSIGLLSSLYQYATFAYIGGGFGAGIHNTLEPATFGIPVVFGKRYKKFHEAVIMLQKKAVFSVSNFSEFEIIVKKLLSDELFVEKAGRGAKAFIVSQKGSSEKILSDCISEDYV